MSGADCPIKAMETFPLMFRATRIESGVHMECLHEPLKESCQGFLRSLGHCSYLGQIGRASSGTLETHKEDLAIDRAAPYQQGCCSPSPVVSAGKLHQSRLGGGWGPH